MDTLSPQNPAVISRHTRGDRAPRAVVYVWCTRALPYAASHFIEVVEHFRFFSFEWLLDAFFRFGVFVEVLRVLIVQDVGLVRWLNLAVVESSPVRLVEPHMPFDSLSAALSAPQALRSVRHEKLPDQALRIRFEELWHIVSSLEDFAVNAEGGFVVKGRVPARGGRSTDETGSRSRRGN